MRDYMAKRKRVPIRPRSNTTAVARPTIGADQLMGSSQLAGGGMRGRTRGGARTFVNTSKPNIAQQQPPRQTSQQPQRQAPQQAPQQPQQAPQQQAQASTQLTFNNPNTTTVNFNSVRSGADKYDVIDSPFFPKAPQRGQYTSLFDRNSLLRTPDDMSKGSLYYGYGKESTNPLDRQLTFADFQHQRPVNEVFGPDVFQPSNVAPEGLLNPSRGESFLGYYNMDAAHIAALGGDDIARMIVENGKERVLRRRLEYTHPKEQQYLDRVLRTTDGWGTKHPHYSSINILGNTIGSGTNTVSHIISGDGFIPVIRDFNPAGSRYHPATHTIRMQPMKPLDAKYDSELARMNDLPALKGENGTYNFYPDDMDNRITLDARTAFHEGIHAGANDRVLKTLIGDSNNFSFTPDAHSKNIARHINDGTFNLLLSATDELSRANLMHSGLMPSGIGYTQQRADELIRAYGSMKDPVVNSIRYRVEQLAPERIPDWTSKATAEQNKIIADTTLDLSEDHRLMDKIINSWGGIKGPVRIPLGNIKVGDPGYMYELLRSMDGIRNANSGLQIYTPEEYKYLSKKLRNNAASELGEDAKNFNMNTWRKKILPQLMPAITAPVAAPVIFGGSGDNQDTNYQ